VPFAPMPPLSAAGVLVGVVWKCCGAGRFAGDCCKLPFNYSYCSLVMIHNDDLQQDAVPTQKLEWVTPRISLMGAGDTEGKAIFYKNEVSAGSGPLS
jgi:hypothetical protein